MTLAVSIRAEQLGDCGPICQVIHEAFRNHPHSSQTEHLTVNALRAAGALELSLVATAGNQLVGHVAFTRVEISDNTDGWYGLGPVAVKPEFHGRGIGTALIESGLAGLQERRAHGCVLLGDPKFYDRFGFRNYPGLVLEGVPQKYFLALLLEGEWTEGRVTYHPVFDISLKVAQVAKLQLGTKCGVR